jgi:hypothetical protein
VNVDVAQGPLERPLRCLRRRGDGGRTESRVIGVADRDRRAAADEEVSALDTLADRARAASERLAGSGGLKGKLAQELADDAVFLRKLKPSLMAKRARGEAPTDGRPASVPVAPSGPQIGRRRTGASGPSPIVVVGVAFAAGIVLAKWIDWRGHAHPRG